MRLAQVVPYYYPAWAYGGPGILVHQMSHFFAKKKHHVTVLTSDAYTKTERLPNSKQSRARNPKVYYFANLHNQWAYVYNFFFTPQFFITVPRLLQKIDVVHIHDFYTFQNFWIGWWCRFFKVPYIVSVHGCLEPERLKQRSIIKQILLHLFGKTLLKKARAVIATSANEVTGYQSVGVAPSQIVSLGHGVNMAEFQTTTSKAQSRKHFGLPATKTIVTYLGRIHSIKGLNQLAKAIALTPDMSLHFVIAGSDDGYLATLKQQLATLKIDNRVTLLGTCFGQDKARLFKASDVFIYPSYAEGFSLGILEAAVAGLPLILSTGCHFPEVATVKAGLVVKNTPAQLSTAITRLTHDQKLRQEFGRNAKALIKKKYSLEKVGQELLDLYESMLA